MTLMDVPVPADEIGYPGGLAESYHHQLGPGYVASSYEETDELMFPNNVAVYDRMRRTDGQIGALLRAIMLSILGNRHHYQHDGVPLPIKTFVETELVVDDGTRRTRRRRHGVAVRDHMREAMLSLPIGFAPFEPVYAIDAPTAEQQQAGVTLPNVAHLRKLALRHPRTVQEIRVNRDGSLAGIIQAGVGWDAAGAAPGSQVIGGPNPSDNSREVYLEQWRLVFYSLDREGGDWAGTSLLRTAYKHWLLKDQLLRTDAIAADRNGMGLPMVYYSEEGSKSEALAIASAMRAGATAGAAIPDGKYRAELLGVTGQVRDPLPSVKYHDEAIGRSALAMFLNLGHDGGLGHGAIGETFRDFFAQSLNTFDQWLCETITEHVVRPLVELNFGTDAPYPVLTCDEISSESTLTAEALKALVDARVITPDDVLEEDVRRRYGLPAADPGTVHEAPTPTAPAAAENPAPAPAPAPAAGDQLVGQLTALTERIADLRAVHDRV